MDKPVREMRIDVDDEDFYVFSLCTITFDELVSEVDMAQKRKTKKRFEMMKNINYFWTKIIVF